jgi:hypothetical protein
MKWLVVGLMLTDAHDASDPADILEVDADLLEALGITKTTPSHPSSAGVGNWDNMSSNLEFSGNENEFVDEEMNELRILTEADLFSVLGEGGAVVRVEENEEELTDEHNTESYDCDETIMESQEDNHLKFPDPVWAILIEVGKREYGFDMAFATVRERLGSEKLPLISKKLYRKAFNMIRIRLGIPRTACKVTNKHIEIIQQLAASPYALERARGDLFKDALTQFKNSGLPDISLRAFKAQVSTLECHYQKSSMPPVEIQRNSRCSSHRYNRILKEIVLENPTLPHKDIFGLVTDRLEKNRIKQISFANFRSRYTLVRKALELSSGSQRSRIGSRASEALSVIFKSNKRVSPREARDELLKSGTLTDVPSLKCVQNWLRYRRRTQDFLNNDRA